jgi:hypothetical protein
MYQVILFLIETIISLNKCSNQFLDYSISISYKQKTSYRGLSHQEWNEFFYGLSLRCFLHDQPRQRK